MNSSEPADTMQHVLPPLKKGAARLTRDAINAMPLFHYTGKVFLVRSAQESELAMQHLFSSIHGKSRYILGFDTETRPSFRKGKSYAPSLVQLASENEVFLFHLKWHPLGPELIRLFEDDAIIKTGVAVHDDMRSLARVNPFVPRSVVDLSELARHNGIEERGLRGLAAAFLGVRISKGEQCSNWGSTELSARQIRYAATDAWASRAVYLRMQELGLSLEPGTALSSSQASKKPKTHRRSCRVQRS